MNFITPNVDQILLSFSLFGIFLGVHKTKDDWIRSKLRKWFFVMPQWQSLRQFLWALSEGNVLADWISSSVGFHFKVDVRNFSMWRHFWFKLCLRSSCYSSIFMLSIYSSTETNWNFKFYWLQIKEERDRLWLTRNKIRVGDLSRIPFIVVFLCESCEKSWQ